MVSSAQRFWSLLAFQSKTLPCALLSINGSINIKRSVSAALGMLATYELNSKPLDVPHGAPLRLRFERQLGYKHAKYVMAIALVNSLVRIGGGKGGDWEDQGYEWYAGI